MSKEKIELPERIAEGFKERQKRQREAMREAEKAYAEFQEKRQKIEQATSSFRDYAQAIGDIHEIDIDYYSLEDDKLVRLPDETIEKIKEQNEAQNTNGTVDASEGTKSGDLNAKEAIKVIDSLPKSEVEGFLSEDEERKTVIEAAKQRTEDA